MLLRRRSLFDTERGPINHYEAIYLYCQQSTTTMSLSKSVVCPHTGYYFINYWMGHDWDNNPTYSLSYDGTTCSFLSTPSSIDTSTSTQLTNGYSAWVYGKKGKTLSININNPGLQPEIGVSIIMFNHSTANMSVIAGTSPTNMYLKQDYESNRTLTYTCPNSALYIPSLFVSSHGGSKNCWCKYNSTTQTALTATTTDTSGNCTLAQYVISGTANSTIQHYTYSTSSYGNAGVMITRIPFA